MKVWVKVFGCRVNQAEADGIKAAFSSAGHADAAGFEDADVCVVNTCAVTGEAEREALALLRRISRRNPTARLAVTGCLAERSPEAVRAAAPAAIVVGNDAKTSLPAMFGCAPAPADADWSSISGRSRLFLKVQDGCNMSCAYCIVPSLRPELSSTPLPELLGRVRAAVAAGVPEIVLCGVRLGRYLWREPGNPRVDLAGLVERLAEVGDGFRIRLSSLEATDATDRLFALMRGPNARLCPSLHLPLQSGNDAVLTRMGRWYSSGGYRRRVEAYRAAVPEGALFADVITGFAGETETEHEESLAFAREIRFDGLHVFRFSPRPGTPGADLRRPAPVVVSRRAAQWHALDAAGRAAHAARAVGGRRVVAPSLSGREGVTEDFLTVALDRPVGPGLTAVGVVGPSQDRELRALVAPGP